MIHLILNNDGASFTKILKDLTADEAESWLLQQIRQQRLAPSYQNLTCSDGDTKVWVSCATNARRSCPVAAELLSAEGKTCHFRGPMAISGRSGENAKINLPQHYIDAQLADGAQVEFGFQNDPIFIPSYGEWLLIPQATKENMVNGLWCWSRTYMNDKRVAQLAYWHDDPDPNDVPTVGLVHAGGSPRNNGAVAAVINIDLLPKDVGTTLRELFDRAGPDVLALRSATDYVHLIRLSDRFCALRSHDIGAIMGGNLVPLHADVSTIKYGYKESSLRQELLKSLDALCAIIRANK